MELLEDIPNHTTHTFIGRVTWERAPEDVLWTVPDYAGWIHSRMLRDLGVRGVW